MNDLMSTTGGRELVMVSNRLPVDRVLNDDGSTSWRTSPGGLVTAVEPIVEQLGCLWVGWAGNADERIEPFDIGSMRLAPVELSAEDIERYYEGFSNGTLWPLYHDVIAQPEYHREWWERYRLVNRRFAERVAESAAPDAIVWVHDYQLQLVPAMLRELRPDLTIAFFLHIPFPSEQLFAQLPWRRGIVEGLLGADVIGFQRVSDAEAFRTIAEQLTGSPALGNTVVVQDEPGGVSRTVLAQEFPISIDVAAFAEVARRPEVRERAREIREELGNPRVLLLGIDRLDYTKGIRHRIKSYAELLADGEVDVDETVFVQVATPSRERVEAYGQLRAEIEETVGRLNGEHGAIGRSPFVYLYHGYTREEIIALYLAADVLLVTPLRDGMNLVAKEYVACRSDERGALVLSEFAGAADELSDALLVNPHDIEGLKAAIMRAMHMPEREQRRRMRAMRAAVEANDVSHWAAGYLGAVQAAAEAKQAEHSGSDATGPVQAVSTFVPRGVEEALRRLAASPSLIVATDFDGTLAPIVPRPEDARILPRAQHALDALAESPGVRIALLSGRSLESLAATGLRSDSWIVSGSHGAELTGLGSARPGRSGSHPGGDPAEGPAPEDLRSLARLTTRFERVFRDEPGIALERKPFGIAVHSRGVPDRERAAELLQAAVDLGTRAGMHVRAGKEVREFSVTAADKGTTLDRIRRGLRPGPALFLGDDVTDEDVFLTLGVDDLGIKVGAGDTAARERVADPETAAAVLALLAELRTGVIVGS